MARVRAHTGQFWSLRYAQDRACCEEPLHNVGLWRWLEKGVQVLLRGDILCTEHHITVGRQLLRRSQIIAPTPIPWIRMATFCMHAFGPGKGNLVACFMESMRT